MTRLGIGLVVSLLAACTVQQNNELQTETTRAGSPAGLASGVVCRIGRDGGPVVADRGIGGTGAPRVADRGIGGTGVVGMITGFASICVNGLEIHYDQSALVDIDGATPSVAALRAGQVVVIQASGPTAFLIAKTILVRREVVGRIESIELGSGMLTISGEPVVVPAGTWGAGSVRLGDWVAVSGSRRSDGTVIASRLDAAPAGRFMVRGKFVRDNGVGRVGHLEPGSALAASLTAGQFVAVSGSQVAGRDQVATVTPDELFANPAGYFGSSSDHLVLQAFVRVARGSVWLNGLKIDAAPDVPGKANRDGIAVVSLERKPDGSFAVAGLRFQDNRGDNGAFSKASTDPTRDDPSLTPQGRRAGGAVPARTDATISPPAAGGQPASASGSRVSTGPVSSGNNMAGFSAPSGTSDAITAPAPSPAAAPQPSPVDAHAFAPTGTGGPTIENGSPQPPSPTSELMSSNAPNPTSPSKSTNPRQPTVVLVSGSSSPPPVGSAVPSTSSAKPAAAVAASSGKGGKVIGTSSSKISPIGASRSNQH